MKKNKYTYHLYLLLFWSLLSSIPSQAQTTRTLNFDCTCPGTTVSFDPESVVLCEGGIDLSTLLEITPNNDLSIEWLNEGTQSDGTATAPGRYTIKVEDQTGCITKKSIEVLDPEAYFKDNCFIAIPISGHTLSPVIGLNGTGSQSRSRMEELTITFPKKDEGDENEESISLDISSIPNDGTSVLVSDSENCTNLSGNIAEYEKGDQILAHVDAENMVLYLGSSAMLDNESGQQIVDDYLNLWSGTTGSDILSAPISYTCGGEQFLETMASDHWWEMAQLFLNCDNFDAEAGGVVPKCFWECYVGTQNFPFISGMIDGGAQLATETVDLVTGVLDFSNLLASYLICSSIQLDAAFYQRLEEKTNTPPDEIKNWIDAKTGLIGLDCGKTYQDLDKIGTEIGKVKEVLTNLSFEQIAESLAQVKEAIANYLKKISNCTDLKTCNTAAYEQGKLILNFASLFVAPEAAVPFLSGLLNGAGKYADDLLEFIRDMNRSPDLLDTDLKKLIAEDPDLFVAWNKLRRLGCPTDFSEGGSTSRSSGTKECKELFQKVFGQPVDKVKINAIVFDTKDDPAFFAFLSQPNMLTNWEYFSSLSKGKSWVRKNTALLERMDSKNLTDNQKKELVEYYKRVRVPKDCNPPSIAPCSLTLSSGEVIEYNSYGFPQLTNHVSDKNHIFSFDNLTGKDSDFTLAKDKLQEYLQNTGTGEVKKVNNPGSWSPFYIERNGIQEGPYTWHHSEDGKTLEPVLKSIHDGLSGKHTGGATLAANWSSLKGFFGD